MLRLSPTFRKFSTTIHGIRHKATAIPPISKKSAWFSDPGSYLVMLLIPISCCLPIAAGIYIMSTSPDCRLSKSSRKNPFRGEYKDMKASS